MIGIEQQFFKYKSSEVEAVHEPKLYFILYEILFGVYWTGWTLVDLA